MSTSGQDIIKKSSLPAGETEILLSYLLGQRREFILTHPETIVSASQQKKFRTLATKRRQGWPLAYLTGHKEFYGWDFKVSPAVLTPRPETEMIVEEILEEIRIRPIKKTTVSDVGTGSGAIIIAAALEIKRLFPDKFREANFLAVDISGAALKIARQNAAQHGLTKKIKFYQGNLLFPLDLTRQKLSGRRLIIAANLPYLTPKQIKQAPSIQREPRLALDGGTDGLKYYRQLFDQLKRLNLPTANLQIICEIDPVQTTAGKKLARKYFPAAAVAVKKDLSGQNRLVIIKM